MGGTLLTLLTLTIEERPLTNSETGIEKKRPLGPREALCASLSLFPKERRVLCASLSLFPKERREYSAQRPLILPKGEERVLCAEASKPP